MDYFGYQDSKEDEIPLIVSEIICDLIDKNFKRNGSVVSTKDIRKLVEKRTGDRLDPRWRNRRNSAYSNSYWVEKICEKFENEGWVVYYEEDFSCSPCRNPSFTFIKMNRV